MRSVTVMIVWFAIAGSTHGLADENHQKLIRDAESIAAEYRSTQGDSDSKSLLKTKVRTLVEQSFDARQTAQREQIREMREKLRRAEETLENREAIRDRIIDRKVEDLLSEQVADWQANTPPEDEFFDVIGIGDTVAVYLPGILPMGPAKGPPIPPNVTVMNSGRLVTGFPLAVGSDGAITLPMVDPIEVAGLTVRQAEEKIAQTYIGEDILRPGKARPMLTLIPKGEASLQSNEPSPVLIENVLGSASASPLPTGVASFEDTYGRLDRARELVAEIRSLQEKGDAWRQTLERMPVQSDQSRRNITKAIANLKPLQETKRFRLELERDYMADVIQQLATELRSKQELFEKAKAKLGVTEQLFTSGATTSAELSDVKSQAVQAEVENQSAELKYSQYRKIAKRWHEIVGDVLDDNAKSEQRVNEGGGGGTGDEGQDDQQQ
ncbi:Polysaccharide biosynthesis/export protein [Stieleria maiorica]|uniref:Polysaccharide biosynthesis/export protein n=1 Tax=Stieleria maiorica TaxID=2795974 RepID=A0A5B9MBN5_9BACT|nr:Polysaccharide biosynthesis/export protein [Stieleria maiorica]